MTDPIVTSQSCRVHAPPELLKHLEERNANVEYIIHATFAALGSKLQGLKVNFDYLNSDSRDTLRLFFTWLMEHEPKEVVNHYALHCFSIESKSAKSLSDKIGARRATFAEKLKSSTNPPQVLWEQYLTDKEDTPTTSCGTRWKALHLPG